MPKKIVKDVGIMQREILQYELHEPGALEVWAKAWDEIISNAKPDDMPGDALDRENARRCKAVLATVGLADFMDEKCAVDCRPLVAKGLNEASAQWLAAHWLAAYHGMLMQRQRLQGGNASDTTIGKMIMDAQDMGRLQERMWWRVGVHKIDPTDKKSWIKRESLALTTGLPVKKGQHSAGQQTNAIHAPTRDARFARMSELVPMIGVDKAAAQCEFEGLGGWQGIKQQWNREKKRDT